VDHATIGQSLRVAASQLRDYPASATPAIENGKHFPPWRMKGSMTTPSDDSARNKMAKKADEHLRSREVGFEIWKTNPENERESFKVLTAGLTLQFEALFNLLRKGERLTEQEIFELRNILQFELFSTILATISHTVHVLEDERE